MKLITILGVLSLLLPLVALTQTYIGSPVCGNCHGFAVNLGYDVYDAWANSGHHWIMIPINAAWPGPPYYPYQYTPGFPNVPNPPPDAPGYTWGDVSYVVGGYYWKARFLNDQGFLITGDSTQYLLALRGWVPFNHSLYDDCGACHTTGYNPSGHQGNLPGIVGTWSESGVGCEACHGPGSAHSVSPFTVNMTVDPSAEQCGTCHYRDTEYRIPYSTTGFIKHHVQYEELVRSPHDALDCVDCHDPHKSTVYDQGGLLANFACENCHDGNYQVAGMEGLECWDCHMAYAIQSAVTQYNAKGDVHSHLININVSGEPRDSVVYQAGNHWYMELDNDGYAQLTLDWVCQSCHPTLDLSAAAAYAENIHIEHSSVVKLVSSELVPNQFAILAAFPNPFNPTTTVEFTLDKPEVVQADLYDVKGRWITQPFSGKLDVGTHHLDIQVATQPSGLYFLKLQAGTRSTSIKLVLLK